MSTETPPKSSSLTRLRNYFLTGFIITAPLVITVYLIWTFVQWVDGWVIPLIPKVYNPETYLPFDIPGVGLIMAMLLITLIGFLTANIIGRSVVSFGEHLLGRTPLVRNIYSGLKQIFQTVFSGESASFKEVGLIEYPRHGLWALVFIATEARGEVNARLNGKNVETLAVFLPTTPNPTSGFLLYVPRKDIIILDMTVEDAAKLVISAGLVTPKYQGKLAQDARSSGAPGEAATKESESKTARAPARRTPAKSRARNSEKAD